MLAPIRYPGSLRAPLTQGLLAGRSISGFLEARAHSLSSAVLVESSQEILSARSRPLSVSLYSLTLGGIIAKLTEGTKKSSANRMSIWLLNK